MIQVAGIYENGHITLLAPIPKKKANVIVTVVEEPEIVPGQSTPPYGEKRIAGLHTGEYFMADDFDDPLPDSFWLGK